MGRTFFICAAVYVIARALYVLALGDVFFYGEELEKGTVAKMLLDGVDLPYARMPFHPYEGGGFVASHLKALMFLVVGENVLAHKVAAILWGLGVVFAAVGIGWRFGGSRGRGGAAMAAGLLVALGPAHLQKQSLLHLGIHYEALLFMGLVFWLGGAVATTRAGEKPSALTLFGLGLASGFGTYFSYQTPIAVLAVIVLLAVTNWRRIFAPPLVAGTLLGLVPLALMYRAVGMEILDIHGSDVGGEGGWSRLFGALRVGFEDPQRLAIFTALAGALSVAAGLVHTRPRGDRGIQLSLLAGFCVLWIVFAGATGMIEGVESGAHWVRFIRFAPLVFALLLIVALSLGPALSSKGEARSTPPAKMARIGITLLVSLGAVHAAQIIDGGDLPNASSNLRTLRDVRGYELRGAFVKIVPRLSRVNDGPDGYGRAVAPLAGLRLANPEFLTAEVASAVAHGAPGLGREALGAALAQAGFAGAPGAAAPGLGAIVVNEAKGNVHGALDSLAAEAPLAEALGRYGPGYLSLEPYVGKEIISARGTAGEAAFLRGAGRRIFRCSVMQLYWGGETRLNPDVLVRRMRAAAEGWQALPHELDALLLGAASAARDFGFGAAADRMLR